MGVKCIRCNTDNNLKERERHMGCCKNCRHPFAFEPTSVLNLKLRFTDVFFAKLLSDISANGTLFFTSKQLFYLLDRRLKRRQYAVRNCIFTGFIVIVISQILVPQANNFLNLGESGAWFLVVPLVSLVFLSLHIVFVKDIPPKIRYRHIQALYFLGIISVIGGIALGIIWSSIVLALANPAMGFLAIAFSRKQLKRQNFIEQSFSFTPQQFQTWLDRWQQVNEPISEMLAPPRQGSLPETINSDITAYSFDRAIICESAEIAQLLIANNFHFESSCAVLSITGYPRSIFQTVMEMLRRNPNLKVYVLHDASPQGITVAHTLRTSLDWFQNTNVEIYDLGLNPRQILATKDMFIKNSKEQIAKARELPQAVKHRLTEDELKWLEAGNFVELESLTPQRILQVLNQGIARSQEMAAGSDGFLLLDNVGNSSSYLFTSDSFG